MKSLSRRIDILQVQWYTIHLSVALKQVCLLASHINFGSTVGTWLPYSTSLRPASGYKVVHKARTGT